MSSLFLIDSSVVAYGISRNDIQNTKIRINNAKDTITKIETDIERQKTTISDKEMTLTQKQNILRELNKSNSDSFSHAKKLRDAKHDILITERQLKTENKKYIDYLNNKSEQINLIKSLESILTQAKKLLSSRITDNKIIEIELSQTCITLIKNSISSTCPTYELLSTLDSSIPMVSGEFVKEDKSGFFHRQAPKIKNSHLWYSMDNASRLIVDAPNGSNFGKIIIMPNFDNYIIKESSAFSNSSRTIYHDRYIDNCSTAKINSNNWEFLLLDTIYHMRNGCSEGTTKYQEAEIIVDDPLSVIDVSQSANYQYFSWLESVQESCKKRC